MEIKLDSTCKGTRILAGDTAKKKRNAINKMIEKLSDLEEYDAILELNEIVYAMYHHKKFEELEKFANDCRGKVVSKHTGIA